MDLLHDINKLPLTNTSQTRLHKWRLLEPTPDRKDEKRLFQDSYVLWHLNFREDFLYESVQRQWEYLNIRKDHHVISTYRLSYNGLIYLLRKMDKLCHLSLCRIRPTKNCLQYEPCTSTEVSLEVQIEEGKVWPYPRQSSSHSAWNQNCTDFVIAQTLTISLKCKTHVKCVLLTLLILSSWSSSKRTCTQARIVATSRHPPCGGDWRATWTSDWRSIWGKTNNKKKVR